MSAYSDAVVAQLEEAAKVFAERSAVYQDNVHMVGKVMEALFPNGHTQLDAADHNRWHIFELMIVKLTRYAINMQDGGHEDSLKDLAVYATMLNALDAELREPSERGGVAAALVAEVKTGEGRGKARERYSVTILGPNDDPREGQDFDWPHRDAVGHGPGSLVDPGQYLYIVQDSEGKSDDQKYCWHCARPVVQFFDGLNREFYRHSDKEPKTRPRDYGHLTGQEPPTPSMIVWHGPSSSAYCNGCGGVLRSTGNTTEMVHTGDLHPDSPR